MLRFSKKTLEGRGIELVETDDHWEFHARYHDDDRVSRFLATYDELSPEMHDYLHGKIRRAVNQAVILELSE